jgi:hypothetical protein
MKAIGDMRDFEAHGFCYMIGSFFGPHGPVRNTIDTLAINPKAPDNFTAAPGLAFNMNKFHD